MSRLETSKLRLKKAFDNLEKAVHKLKRSTSSSENNLKRIESLMLEALDRINKKITTKTSYAKNYKSLSS